MSISGIYDIGLDTRENSYNSRGNNNESEVDIDTFERTSLLDFLENPNPSRTIYNSRYDI